MGKQEQIEWEAPEYVVQEKGTLWFVIFGIVAVGGTVGLVLLTSWVMLALWILMVVAMVIRSVVKPRIVKYRLTEEVIVEGEKEYAVKNFKTFGVIRDGNSFLISLRPNKRFGLRLNIVIPDNKGEKIVDFFGARMPMEEVTEDLFDKIVRWLKI